ncbi:unnamed protein product [Cylindrotheca closterium]|uniref:Uncharacterized protein n=1 Tax=Cylindrotheca closterium TaxID=2856 RepID=A0AAD2FU15_9STRA|nr:unnamed protein product [Cylindrotheca closterium]
MLIALISAVAVFLFLAFVMLPLVLALRDTFKEYDLKHSKLYTGRVWHTRLQPKLHAFTYPIFIFALDLKENLESFMSPILEFRESDHLKNGEGIVKEGGADNSLVERVLRLVQERTNGKCAPAIETHRVTLLTHLSYYGYNFNPVSFYYVTSKETNELTVMVAEVSNTPWLEQHSYVLHKDSVDKVKHEKKDGSEWFTFPKDFHVSPFMEMDYMYDFIYAGLPENKVDDAAPMTIINNLRSLSNDKLAFSAKLEIEAQSITPFGVAWQLIRFPGFCMILQIWIHYQAAWLFIKGIVFVPHPQGSETAATRAIATFMAPFFALRDRVGSGASGSDGVSTSKAKAS